MSSKIILDAFHSQFADFIVDMRLVFPDNVDLAAIQKLTKTLRKVNPKLLANQWYSHVAVPYADEITRGDIQFFLHKDYTNDINDSGIDNSEQIIHAIDDIRSMIHEMEESDMQKSMEYVQNLSRLSDAVMTK